MSKKIGLVCYAQSLCSYDTHRSDTENSGQGNCTS